MPEPEDRCKNCGHPYHEHTIGVIKNSCHHSYNQADESVRVCTCPVFVAQLEPQYDAVRIPSHYNSGQIEVANFIADQDLRYPRDNIIKYVVRAGKKNPEKELEDIEKAAAYLQMAYNLAQGLPAVVRDPLTNEVVWSLFRN